MPTIHNVSPKASTQFSSPAEISSDVSSKERTEPQTGFLPAQETSPEAKRLAAERQRRKVVFGSLSPVEFARKKIGRLREPANPDGLFNDFRQYPFSDDEKLEIAKIWPFYTDKHSHQFVFNNPDKKIDFVGFLVSESPFRAAEICWNFGVSKQEDLIRVGNYMVDDHACFISEFLEQFPVEDESQRFKWACKMAEKDPCNFEDRIEKFRLTQSHQRETLFIAAKSLSPKTCIGFKDQNFLTQDDKLNLFMTLAESAPGSCVYSMPNFPAFGDVDRLRLARKVGEKDACVLFHGIEEFALNNQPELLSLYITHFPEFTQSSMNNAIEFEKGFARDCAREIDIESVSRFIAHSSHQCTESFFGNAASNLPGFQQHASQLRIKLPCIAEFLDISRTTSNPELREVLGTWAHCAHLCFSKGDIPESFKDHLTSSLQGIFQYRQPEARYPLTILLAEVVNPEPKDQFFAQRFSEISAALTKPHARVFRPLLCALTPDAPSAENMIAKYASLLSRDGFKDTNRQRNIVNGFLALIQANHIEDSEKQRLLKVLTPATHGKNDVKAFAQTMQNLADFIPLTTQEKIKGKAMKELSRIRKNDDFDAAFGKLFMEILRRNEDSNVDEAELKEFMQRVKQANEHFRRPNAILNYASKLYAELGEGEEKEEIFKVLNRCVDTAILAASPQSRKVSNSRGETGFLMLGNSSQAFLEEKNDISRSKHLQRAYALDADATLRFLTMEKEVKNVFEKYGQTDSKVNVTEYLHDRIVRDRHVSRGTFPIIEHILEQKLSSEEAEKTIPDLHGKLSPSEKLLLELLNEEEPKEKIKVFDRLLAFLDIENESERTEFTNNLRDLRSLLLQQSQPKQDVSGWSLKFAQDFEDYLLSGTEVIGSCQHIEGTPHLNKALMGYVMQGKNRTITLNSPDGTIQARCIVRLGIDEESNTPVLHMEDSYQNPGVPGNCHEIFGRFACGLSEEIGGIPIVTHSSKYGETKPYQNSIHFLPDTARCEYVDSEGLGVVNSREGYVFKEVAVLA